MAARRDGPDDGAGPRFDVEVFDPNNLMRATPAATARDRIGQFRPTRETAGRVTP